MISQGGHFLNNSIFTVHLYIKEIQLLLRLSAFCVEVACKRFPLRTADGNTDGAPCVFPFVYKGQNYTTCTDAAESFLWCATTNNYDSDEKWSKCVIGTTGGTLGGGDCVFPSAYAGKWQSDCIHEDKESRDWCYGKERNWGYCRKGDFVCDVPG